MPKLALTAQYTSLTDEQFTRLRDQLAAYSGVYLDVARQRVLEIGLAQRLAATGDTFAEYEQRLAALNGREELRQLAELVLNHETFFFRNKAHMRALTDVLLAELHARKPINAPLRLWSAGCATGEEAYSLAIVALEALATKPGRTIEIWATDMSQIALEHARVGYYQGRALANVTPEQLARYFVPRGRGYVVSEALRRTVRFEALNLLEAFPPAAQGVDIIFCQNVLIYFQLETCRAVLERFYACLPEGGLLCLGFSETLWNVFNGFRVREVAGGYVYYKEALKTPYSTEGKRTQPRRATTTPNTNRRIVVPRVTNTRVQALDHIPIPANASDEALLLRGNELLSQNQPDQALDVLRRVSSRSTCAEQAWMLAARIHADRGDLDLAVAEVQRTLAINTLHEQAHVLLGIINGRQGNWSMAAHAFERARYLNPTAPLISYYLAESLQQIGRTEAAAREYRNALQKLDRHPPGELLDGVAVEWLKSTCQLQLERLAQR